MTQTKTGEHQQAKPTPNVGQCPVSNNNPCPFLRALVAEGLLPDDKTSLNTVSTTIVDVTKTPSGKKQLPKPLIYLVALIANGFWPRQWLRNLWSGVRLNQLRNGPLDKKGVGSSILNSHADINESELNRLKQFASNKTNTAGQVELGLNSEELIRMMDANFARAKGRRRKIDRTLMNGEWPVLLKVMGKDGTKGRYLSLSEVQTLFIERKLPERMHH